MNFRELYDVSVSLSPQLAVWPGDPAIEINKASQISQGANANVTQLSIGAHIGTHVDAPVHFIDGATGVDQFPLEALVGPAYVVNFTFLQHDIGAADLENANLPSGTERVLFKTRNSAFWQTDPTRFHRD